MALHSQLDQQPRASNSGTSPGGHNSRAMAGHINSCITGDAKKIKHVNSALCMNMYVTFECNIIRRNPFFFVDHFLETVHMSVDILGNLFGMVSKLVHGQKYWSKYWY